MNITNLINFLLTENVDERIRSMHGKKFRMNEFTNLTDIEEMHSYARQRLQYLGKGSSRTVFVLSSRYVLKLAGIDAYRDQTTVDVNKGLGQNGEEVRISNSPLVKDLVAHVHQHDPDREWIVADLVRPVDYQEFQEMTGITSWELTYLFSDVDIIRLIKEYPDLEDVLDDNDLELATNPFVLKLARAAAELNLLPGDIHVDHFGKTPDGRIVLFDYGFTKEVRRRHYW